MTRFAELREKALAANLDIVEAGLVVLAFGNASAVDRDSGVMAIKPSGVPYPELCVESMVVVDLETGNVVEGSLSPSSDTPTHLVLYRRFVEIGGVVHTHSPYATAWAQVSRPIPCYGTTHADHFHGHVPVTRALTVSEIDGDYEAETGAVICETFEAQNLEPLDVPAVLVASHGPFTWGGDAARAVENAVAIEAIAALAYRTTALGAPRGVEPITGALLERHFYRKHGTSAYYGQGR